MVHTAKHVHEINYQHLIIGLLISLLAVVAALISFQSEGAETVLVRGIVKSGGDANSISLHYTHVASAPDPSKIRGLVRDVDLDTAVKYQWVRSGNSLVRKKASSLPTPGSEVVVKGILRDDERIVASWIVQNYRQVTLEGTLEGVRMDTGSTDAGWVTVNVTSSKMRGISPARAFKESQVKDKDILVRVNGLTAISALGKVKQLDEVTASNQKVRIEGELEDENTWVAGKLNEI